VLNRKGKVNRNVWVYLPAPTVTFISSQDVEKATKHGLKRFPNSMRKNLKTGCQAGKKRTVAIDQNMPSRHRRGRTDRFCNQDFVFGSAAGRGFHDILEGRNLYGET
jgi:hypothetical protein